MLQLLATAFPSLKKLQREEGPQVRGSALQGSLLVLPCCTCCAAVDCAGAMCASARLAECRLAPGTHAAAAAELAAH